MIKLMSKEDMVKTLASIFDVALTSKAVKDSWKWNYKNIQDLKRKRIHTAVLVVGNGNGFDVRALIRWSEPHYENDIQVRLYLDDDVVNNMCCAYDPNIIRLACKKALTPSVVHRKDSVDDVDSVESFLAEYYRRDRFTESLVVTYKNELAKYGFCMISKHDSRTGKSVSYYGK